MKIRLDIRRVALAAALAAAATAWAASQNQPTDLIVIAQYGGSSDPITVEERRFTADGRLQIEVMTRLRAMDNIQGLIGVETEGGAVRLTGLVTTTGQAYRAGREAMNASGVRGVDNCVRGRLGASY